MQELFIKNINNAVQVLLNGSNKKINSQLIITTHSSHILNSKIHTSSSFDNINYIAIVDNLSHIINLNDDVMIEQLELPLIAGESQEDNDARALQYEKKRKNDLKFIKKHIKFKVSEIFFADAIIFVEGITEETLLSYYIDNNLDLNKYYITVFNINGAHGLVYHQLIKLLKIPTIIITDLDIKRTAEEKKTFTQISSLSERKTTNNTIIKYNSNDDINDIEQFFEDENLYITFQNESIEGYFATSLEESLILKNYSNEILNRAIEVVKPNIYIKIF